MIDRCELRGRTRGSAWRADQTQGWMEFERATGSLEARRSSRLLDSADDGRARWPVTNPDSPEWQGC
ncbi:hypothetical protein CKO29_12685 [Allochromatium vinosum]|nr:hypothetical protein [Allochromatium vinosum]